MPVGHTFGPNVKGCVDQLPPLAAKEGEDIGRWEANGSVVPLCDTNKYTLGSSTQEIIHLFAISY